MLEDWVRGGGTLVCGDPGAFSWAPDGSETSIARERLLGIRTGPPMAAWSVMVGEKRVPLFPRRTEDGLQPTARTITLGGDPAEILGRYPDGTPAVIRRGLGQGKVIYFAANPFTPESLFHGAPWTELLKGFQKDAGEPMGLDIWRFKLPGPSAPAKKPPG
jgi:hypothetical protein